MTVIRPTRPNSYTGNPLDRAGDRRVDEPWIAGRLADPTSLFLPVWRARNLIQTAGDGQAAPGLLAARDAAGLGAKGATWMFLGLLRDRAVFTLDISALDDPEAALPQNCGAFEDLRHVSAVLSSADASLLAHARAIVHWRARHRFCGVCGALCEPRSAGQVMSCPNCGAQHFPRTDPAVIMLVHRAGSVLLGHSARFARATMYSTLAGFVEPGESLEEAVAREVREETGIVVGRTQYHSSQPWPFPSSVMLGFYAEALSEEITIDRHELSDARWFGRTELADPERHGFSLPGPDSIARRLIEDWLMHQSGLTT